MTAPQPIPYQGSKRILAPLILSYLPKVDGKLIEPFAGSAAISIASALRNKYSQFHINDINAPLINLLKDIVEEPELISAQYEELWNRQLGNEKEFFLETRAKFNKNQRVDYFLYILARCVKGAVRYNSAGDFNQSADNRRKGKNPKNMKRDILHVSNLLKGKAVFDSIDYCQILNNANENDLIYMDPPYQGTSMKKDSRYFSGLDENLFIEQLHELNNRNISFAISYDGKLGNKTYGNDLPDSLGLRKILIEVGRSTTSTLLGNSDITYESLYLSEALINKKDFHHADEISLKPQQLQLL